MTGMPVTRPLFRVGDQSWSIAMRTLSIVVPVKDERENVDPLYRQVKDVLRDGFAWELVYVDDGSTDGTFDELTKLAAFDSRVKVVRLRRNFGQAAAMQAGIDAAGGELVVTMDGDLQNDPADIPLLVAKLDEGYDMILGLPCQAAGFDDHPQGPQPHGQLADPQGHQTPIPRFRLHITRHEAARLRGTSGFTAKCTGSSPFWPATLVRG